MNRFRRIVTRLIAATCLATGAVAEEKPQPPRGARDPDRARPAGARPRYGFSAFGGFRALQVDSRLFDANEVEFGLTEDDFRSGRLGFELDYALLPMLEIVVGFDTGGAETDGNYLDLGPAGILVPEVRAEVTVREAVHFFYYPQFGSRSWGGNARHGIAGRADRLEYAAWWNDTGVLWLQLESVDAVINCRKLAQKGVDVLTFGPNDLMFDIERYRNPPFRTVDDCVRHVAREMEGTSVAVSLALLDPSDRQKYTDMGLTVLQTPMVV